MNIKITLISLLVLFTTLEFNAQVFGYMGQKFTTELNLGLSYSNAYEKSNFTYETGRRFERVFKVHPELSLNYTIGKRVDMGIDIGYQKFESNVNSKYSTSDLGESSITYRPDLTQINYNNYNNYTYFYPKEVANSTISINVDFYLRIYSRRHLAPVGVYHQFGFGFNTFKFVDEEIEGYLYGPNQNGYEVSRAFLNTLEANADKHTHLLKSFTLPRFSYRIGKKMVAASGFYLNLSAEINFIFNRSLSSQSLQKNRAFDSHSYYLHYADAYNNSEYLKKSQRFELKIGLGKTF